MPIAANVVSAAIPPGARSASGGTSSSVVLHIIRFRMSYRKNNWVDWVGSKLPKLFQWFTGNIGLHHIHHLSPKTPNYLLQKCYDENPILHKAALTFGASLKCIFLDLWDEQQQKLVSFGSLKSLPQAG